MGIIDYVIDKKTNDISLEVYHSNLRNIGIFITISLATNNFNYQTKFMKNKGKYVVSIAFLLVSFLLNLELLYTSIENYENTYIIDIVPFITMILIIIITGVTVYNVFNAK